MKKNVSSKKKQAKYGATAGVILAAGNSERMGISFKQFIKIKGKPLLFYSLEKFLSSPAIDRIIITVPKIKLNYASKIISDNYHDSRIEIISGGGTRKESSFIALKHLGSKGQSFDYVIFHDAARPLISPEIIAHTIREAKKYGAAVVGKSAVDLIFCVENGHITSAIRKEKIHYGYTPQCFKFDDIFRAHKNFRDDANLKMADNVELLLRYDKNLKIKMIDGFYPNLKLTYKEDLRMIEPFLK